jgi:hypothetical protein
MTLNPFSNFRQRLRRVISGFIVDPSTRKFLDHNRKIWGANKRGGRRDGPEVLFEFNPFHSSLIAYSYLANVLADKHGARIVAYGYADSIRWFLYARLASNTKRTYLSFNTSQFVNVTVNRKQARHARQFSEEAYARLNSTRDVEDLVIDGIWIGDLVYDAYLKFYRVPTVDLKSQQFKASLQQFMEYFVFWRDYLDTHEVKAISVSHCVYTLAIPLRLAVKRGIPVYQASALDLYHLSESQQFAYNDFTNYPEKFRALPQHVQENGLREAEIRIKRRLSGEIGVDMPYSKKSAYGEIRQKSIIRKSDREKILVAAHCFFDSPHSYGKNLFPDFYEWLSFLGQLSETTDYDWYIKTHPDFIPETKALVESFAVRFPKFTVLPPETSHHQIIKEGIGTALTVYGTIGLEYAAMGVTVINASINNPHVGYQFNIHPRSVEEYESILRNLGQQEQRSIDLREVHEYYFMRFLHTADDWLFDDYFELLKTIGDYREQFTPRVYELFLKEFSSAKHESILRTLCTFLDSGDFQLNQEHMDQTRAP